jgi:hypothetical protein
MTELIAVGLRRLLLPLPSQPLDDDVALAALQDRDGKPLRSRAGRRGPARLRQHAPRPLDVGRCDAWLGRLIVTLRVTRHGRRRAAWISYPRTRRPLGRPALRIGQLCMSRGEVMLPYDGSVERK